MRSRKLLVAAEMNAAPGRYSGFKYQGKYGNQIGWWNPKSTVFAGSVVSDDGERLVVTTVFKASRAYVNRLLKSGWR